MVTAADTVAIGGRAAKRAQRRLRKLARTSTRDMIATVAERVRQAVDAEALMVPSADARTSDARPDASETASVAAPGRILRLSPDASRTRTGRTVQTRSDQQMHAILADTERVTRDPDGTVPVRRAQAALRVGAPRARQLLSDAGLLRVRDITPDASQTQPEPAKTNGHPVPDLVSVDPTDDTP
jgi:hypothetical protein